VPNRLLLQKCGRRWRRPANNPFLPAIPNKTRLNDLMSDRPGVQSGLWAASQLIGKARIAETLGEGGEVLLPTKHRQLSQIGGAQIGITFECS
jgi:hypothetical protein